MTFETSQAVAVQRAKVDVLPLSLPPRGLNRVQAAAYVGLGATKFDELVAAKKMPGPKRVGCRAIWDRKQLDSAFEALPDDNDHDDPWEDVAV